jgi:hypothetical protein
MRDEKAGKNLTTEDTEGKALPLYHHRATAFTVIDNIISQAA